MLYAFEDDLISVVGAADTLIEYEDFIRKTDTTVFSPEKLGVKNADIVSLMDLLTEDRYQGFKKAPVVIEHTSNETKAAFNEKFQITVLKRYAVVTRHEDMLVAVLPDPYSSENTDTRTIEEIYNLETDDQWDKRTEEEKAEDAEQRKRYKELKEKGELSGDSFGPNPDRAKKKPDSNPAVGVTDIKAHRDDDGSLVIDDVLAVKGLHDAREGEEEDYAARIKAPIDPNREPATLRKSIDAEKATKEAQISAINADDADDENLEIDTGGVVAIYHKVEVTGSKLGDCRSVLEAADIDPVMAIAARNNSLGCWFAYLRQLQAEETMAALVAAGFEVETYAVNDAGERLVPKGVQVVDHLKESDQLPRPWNFRAGEIRKMKAEEKRENQKSIKPAEFIFCGNYEGAALGTIIYITPRSYFRDHNKMWEKSLDIAHILPQDFKEVSPGVYRSNSRDWNNISFDLASRGFKENLMLQIYLNSN